MKSKLAPVAISGAVTFLILFALVMRASQLCGGHIGYPLDDTYIHMAMAKNFVEHGVWGTTRYGFTSSTSSPLYTLTLSAIYLASGVREITPLLINCAAVVLFLLIADFVLRSVGFDPRWRTYLMLFVALAVPLPILALTGLEHTLHAALTLLFVYLCCTCLDVVPDVRPRPGLLLAITPLLALTRYEAGFVVAVAGLLLLLRRKAGLGAALGLMAAIPIAVYGWISVAHGWYFLPTSILLKGNIPSTHKTGIYQTFFPALWGSWRKAPHLIFLTITAYLLLFRSRRKNGSIWTFSGIALVLFCGTATLHLFFARTHWFFRYEAYLVALGVIVCAAAVHLEGARHLSKLVYAFAVLSLGFLAIRTAYSHYRADQAIKDIYDQQYQMGRFVRANLNDQTIVLNDIGAVSFLSDARILDAVGLGSLEAAEVWRRGEYSPEWLAGWVARSHAAVAIMYPPLAPAVWVPESVGAWTIPGNYMSGSDTVNFYVLEPAVRSRVIQAMQEFRAQLPKRVVVRQFALAQR